jgi:hypothetical protein
MDRVSIFFISMLSLMAVLFTVLIVVSVHEDNRMATICTKHHMESRSTRDLGVVCISHRGEIILSESLK